MEAGTAQLIQMQWQHLMNTAQETWYARNGMEIIATNGNAQHFLQAQ